MSVECLQEAMRKAYMERDVNRGVYATFTWLVEEVGELAEALLEGKKERVEEEIADVIAWTLSLANMLGVEVKSAMIKKYGEELRAVGCTSS
ncbi:MAG: nucleotide pyrophosphohydrolase [Acidilobaceae archaeon]|nr:nucleotide pyrophosphohydrolase [Acidilobaceae archaeon]MCX8164998.1 nucleotide pyrophosphohydrolase [Acidilobaceae archaeon]MDW7974485.1 MazG nucleotide pyrophosphohydrolase domain-containing protein [Sulfolobales archaeon]